MGTPKKKKSNVYEVIYIRQTLKISLFAVLTDLDILG